MIRSERGMALLMVLWIITILMVLVVSFSLLTRTDARSTILFRERTQKKFYAEAGTQRAVMELYHRQVYLGQAATTAENEVVKVDGRPYNGTIGDGSYIFRLFDESGKINLNKMTDLTGVVFQNLLVNLGVSKDRAETIVDSVLDWVDGDSLHRLHGAEDEHYMSLPNPYKAKNGPMATIEELLLVSGMTPEILFGDGGQQGLAHFVTVHGEAFKIDINTAPKEVLLALPGMAEDKARQIMQRRENAAIGSMEEVQAITGLSTSLLSPYADIAGSNIYTIESLGFDRTSVRGYGIRTVVVIQGGGSFRFIYYRSPSEIKR